MYNDCSPWELQKIMKNAQSFVKNVYMAAIAEGFDSPKWELYSDALDELDKMEKAYSEIVGH